MEGVKGSTDGCVSAVGVQMSGGDGGRAERRRCGVSGLQRSGARLAVAGQRSPTSPSSRLLGGCSPRLP